MNNVDRVHYALYISSLLCLRISLMLPDTDIVDEIRCILTQNCSMSAAVVSGESIERQEASDLIDVCHALMKELDGVKDAVQE